MRLASASMSVLFPDPLAPSTAMISPSRASPEMLSSSVFILGASGSAVSPPARPNGRHEPFFRCLTLYVRSVNLSTNGSSGPPPPPPPCMCSLRSLPVEPGTEPPSSMV